MPLFLTVPASEMYDERANLFIEYPAVTLQLEHSLLSISKWEAKHNVPFLAKDDKTIDEFVDYIRCMTITPHVDPSVYTRLGQKEFEAIQNYITAPMTASSVHDSNPNRKKPRKNRVITSELVYYWMCVAQIPFEAEKWHFNRLMMLIRIHDAENDTQKMPKNEAYKHHKSLNASRRAAHRKKH